MIIRGANSAITREEGCALLDMRQLMHLLTRRERLTLIRMLEAYNEDEKRATISARAAAPKRATQIVR